MASALLSALQLSTVCYQADTMKSRHAGMYWSREKWCSAVVLTMEVQMRLFGPNACEYVRQALHTLYAFLPLMPPSTSIHGATPASSHICLSLRTFSTWYSINFCPPKPGFTVPRERLSSTFQVSECLPCTCLSRAAGLQAQPKGTQMQPPIPSQYSTVQYSTVSHS